MKYIIKKINFLNNIKKKLNNLNERNEWVKKQIESLPKGSSILDAGCGSQRYKYLCKELNYFSQDFGKYKKDEKKTIGIDSRGLKNFENYSYGDLDYVGDIWDIKEDNEKFDAILCTEVLEHIPYPIETIKEFSRLLKKGGILILTAPSNCLRHMDPFFFSSGFSDRWYEKFLPLNKFEIEELVQVGDYYRWIATEIGRTAMTHSLVSKILLFPAFIYFFYKKKNKFSINTLAEGYHIRAKKL